MPSNLLDLVKPQLDAMNEMYAIGYKAGIAEGRRQAMAEIARDLEKIQESTHEASPKNQA